VNHTVSWVFFCDHHEKSDGQSERLPLEYIPNVSLANSQFCLVRLCADCKIFILRILKEETFQIITMFFISGKYWYYWSKRRISHCITDNSEDDRSDPIKVSQSISWCELWSVLTIDVLIDPEIDVPWNSLKKQRQIQRFRIQQMPKQKVNWSCHSDAFNLMPIPVKESNWQIMNIHRYLYTLKHVIQA
jgi:hypothetical protein